MQIMMIIHVGNSWVLRFFGSYILRLSSGKKCRVIPHGKLKKSTICGDTTTLSCCALKKARVSSYRSPETVELNEVLFVIDC